MLDAVVDMVAQSAQSCLKVVRIIIFQPAMMKDFLSRMEKRAASDKQEIGWIGTIKGKQPMAHVSQLAHMVLPLKLISGVSHLSGVCQEVPLPGISQPASFPLAPKCP